MVRQAFLDIEHMRTNNDCGPVAMLQLLRWAGLNITYEALLDIWGWTGSNTRDLPWDHHRVLKELGLKPLWLQFKNQIDLLLPITHMKVPVVQLIRIKGFKYHWQVVYGYNIKDKTWLVSTGHGKAEVPAETMDRVFFNKHFDTFLFGIRGIGYVVDVNSEHFNKLGKFWLAKQKLLSILARTGRFMRILD